MASMWTCADAPRSPSDYEEIYIHAKVAIVDDAAFTIGSTNLNVRSMALDSELNVLSQAQDVAFILRESLFRQCSKSMGPAHFGDMKVTFNKWLKIMAENLDLMQNTQPLTAQILPFHVDRTPTSPII